jgi:hypothetical protein
MKSLLSISILLTIVFNALLIPAYGSTLSNYSVGKILQANELQQDDKLTEAITVLEEYDPSREYDKAYINRMLAGFYWQKQDPNNTIRLLTLAVDAKKLPVNAQRETLTMLADILIAEGEYRLSQKRYYELLPLLEESKALELVWLRLAQSQYQLSKWALVEKSVKQQQHFQTLAKIEPRVLPLNMQLGAQLAQQKWKSAIQTTASLRELEPQNEVWWRQLIALYMQTHDHRNALITLQQAERAKFVLSNQQLTLMAQLYAQSGVPYQAAKTYERLSDIGRDPELIAQQAYYWQQAKEWQLALMHWDRAANLKPQYYKQYALLAIQQRELENALSAIDRMPNKDASLLVIKTQILNEMGKTEVALNTITLAHQLSPSDSTATWLRYLTQHQAIR